MTNYGPIAGASVDNSNSNGRVQLYAGEADIVSTQGKLVTGVSYVGGQVLGRVAATGLFAKHDPAATDGSENATAILAYDVETPIADKYEAIYVGGVFNIEALTFNAATDDADKMAAVFDGTNIVAQRLYGAPAPNSGPV
jgi:hypothetical protein